MPTWRIHVHATDAEKAKEFKEARENFKALYSEAGTKLTFEFSMSGEKQADELAERAKALGFKTEKEQYTDPLENVEGTAADFW